MGGIESQSGQNVASYMNRWRLILIALVAGVASCFAASEQVRISLPHRFLCERYGAQNGVLYRSPGSATNSDDHVRAVLVDSRNRVWVGTVAGLSVLDGKHWSSTNFPISGMSYGARLALRSLQVVGCGPDIIREGPGSTVWFSGPPGVWRFREGRYEHLDPASADEILDIAVDREGGVWSITKTTVKRNSGGGWETVLCPYVGKPKSSEARGLCGIAIDANGRVWVGGTVYGKPKQPWTHEGPVWAVDEVGKRRGGGPPMAALFEFTGAEWRAFGAPHGLDAKWTIPELDGQGRITLKTAEGRLTLDERAWKPIEESDAFANKRWLLVRAKGSWATRGSRLLFRDHAGLVEVPSARATSGEVLDLESEPSVSLRIAADDARGCVWVGTWHGLYRIWRQSEDALNNDTSR